MNRPPLPLAIVFVGAAAFGCGESKEEEAIKRVQNRAKPGYFRVVNLSGAPVAVTNNERPLMGEVAAGEFSRLVPFAAGNGKVRIGTADVEISLKSDEGASIVVYPGAKADQIGGEIRRPAEANVKVFLAPGDGSASIPAGGIKISGSSPSTIDASTKTLSLNQGDYEIAGQKISIEPKLAYTFLFVPFQKRLHAFLMLNTPNDQPAGASAASS